MYRLPRALTLRQHPLPRQYTHTRRIPRIQSRPRSQYVHSINNEPVRYQAVRFKKPGLTLRRIVTIGLYTGVVYFYVRLLWQHMEVEIEIVEDGQEEGAEKTEGQEGEQEPDGPPFYADENSTFIPLTWSRPLPRSFYRGSDPEWQEFIRIAKDKPRHKKIQDELVQIVYTGSCQHPSIARQLGKDAKVGKYWLDISFPDGPPQEFERSGIEVGDGFVAWSQQKVSQEGQWRLMRALWPQAAAQGSWAVVKVLAGIQWRRMKQALGWEGADPLSPEERWRVAMEMMGKQTQQREGKREVGRSQTDPDGTPGSIGRSSDPPPTTTNSSDKPRLPWHVPVPLPSAASTATGQTDIPIAMHVFSASLSKTWNPKKMEPPRGSVVVQGLVEVRGQKGRMLFDVQSSYDPRQGKYLQVNAGVRGFKRWSQAPRGGP